VKEDGEVRSYPERFKWDGELRYKLYNRSPNHPFTPSQIVSIGLTGLSFITPLKIHKGSILVLKLYRYQNYSPIRVLAKVRHCDWAQTHEGFEIDCSFHDLTPGEKDSIHEVVEEVCFIVRIHSHVKRSLSKTKAFEPFPKKSRKRRWKRKNLKKNLKR